MKIQFYIHLIQFTSLFYLTQGFLEENANFGYLTIDALYADYILGPASEFPAEKRANIRRLIGIECCDLSIGKSIQEMTRNTVAIASSQTETHQRSTVAGGQNNSNKSNARNFNESVIGIQILVNLLLRLSESRTELYASVASKGIDRLKDRDVCRFWALHRHVKKFQENLAKFGDVIGWNCAAGEKWTIFSEPKECARLNRLRKSSDASEQKWLADYEQDLTNCRHFLLEKTMRNRTDLAQQKLAHIFIGQKAIWENELTFRLRIEGFLYNENAQLNALKTVAKSRIGELFNEKNAEMCRHLYDKYPSLTYGIDFYNWHMSLYAQLFCADAAEMEKIRAKMELLAFFHAIEMIYGQMVNPKCHWHRLRIELAQIFDAIVVQSIHANHQKLNKQINVLKAKIAKFKSYLQVKQQLSQEISKHEKLNEELDEKIKILGEIEHLSAELEELDYPSSALEKSLKDLIDRHGKVYKNSSADRIAPEKLDKNQLKEQDQKLLEKQDQHLLEKQDQNLLEKQDQNLLEKQDQNLLEKQDQNLLEKQDQNLLEKPDQHLSDAEFGSEPDQNDPSLLDPEFWSETNHNQQFDSEPDQNRSTSADEFGSSSSSYPETPDDQSLPEAELFLCLRRLSLLKANMEQYNDEDKEMDKGKISMKSQKSDLISAGDIMALQDEISQMHGKTMAQLAMARAEFCQKINEMGGVELIGRFSVLFPLDKMSLVWPTVRKCRVDQRVADWSWYTHGQSIRYNDTDAALLANCYTDLFNNNDELFNISKIAGNVIFLQIYIKIQQMDIFFQAAIWLMNNLIEELLLFMDTIFGRQINEENNGIMNKLWHQWASTLYGNENAESFAQKFCALHKYAINIMAICWMNTTEMERDEVKEMLRKRKWSEMTIVSDYLPSQTSQPFSAFTIPQGTDYTEKECANVVRKLKEMPNTGMMHSLTLYRLIRRLDSFKDIFSGSKQSIEAKKNRLFLTIGSVKAFDTLEKLLPEQLHIDTMCQCHRLSLYTNLLTSRSSSHLAQTAQMRLATTMLLTHFKMLLYDKINDGTVPMMETRTALGILRTRVFNNIDRVDGLCWLMYMMKHLLDSSGKIVGTRFVLPPDPMIMNCIVEDARLPQFKQYWDQIEEWHYQTLAQQENGIPFVAAVLEHNVPGAVTRLKRLVGNKLFAKLCAQHPEVCTYSNKAFDDEQVLMDFYKCAILYAKHFSEIERLSAKLAADMIVFIRWFDAEPMSAKMKAFWHQKREELKEEYDEIFDENFAGDYGLGQSIASFERSCHALRHFLITNRHCDQDKVMGDAWRKLIKRLENDRLRDKAGEKQQHNNSVVVEARHWLNSLHADQFKRLLSELINDDSDRKQNSKKETRDDQRVLFAKQIKSGLNSMAEAHILLIDFLGAKEVDNIFKMLGIVFKFDDLNERMRKNSDESKKKNKKKKQKRKAKRAKMDEEKNDTDDKASTNKLDEIIVSDKVSPTDDSHENDKVVTVDDKVSKDNVSPADDSHENDKVVAVDDKVSKDKVSPADAHENEDDKVLTILDDDVPQANENDKLSTINDKVSKDKGSPADADHKNDKLSTMDDKVSKDKGSPADADHENDKLSTMDDNVSKDEVSPTDAHENDKLTKVNDKAPNGKVPQADNDNGDKLDSTEKLEEMSEEDQSINGKPTFTTYKRRTIVSGDKMTHDKVSSAAVIIVDNKKGKEKPEKITNDNKENKMNKGNNDLSSFYDKRSKDGDKITQKNDKITTEIDKGEAMENDQIELPIIIDVSENFNNKTKKKHRSKATRKNSGNNSKGIEATNDGKTQIEKSYKIEEIKDDDYLLGHCRRLLTHPNEFSVEHQRQLLEYGIYSNEIWHRILAAKHFAKFGIPFWHSRWHFERKWDEMQSKNVLNADAEQLQIELYQMLRSLSPNVGQNSDEKSIENYEKMSWQMIGQKLYRNWLARRMVANAGGLAPVWDALDNDVQVQAITVIFAAENENRKSKKGKRKSFAKYAAKWVKTVEQLHIDQRQFEEFVKNGFILGWKKPAEWRAHIEYVQQINFDNNELNNFQDELEPILIRNGHGGDGTSKEREIHVHFNTIRSVVREWSNGQSDLLMGGSMMLDTFTVDSDVDTICVAPEHIRAEHFFGTASCHQKFADECRNDESLFCQLCFHPEVHSLQRLPSNWVPLIRLQLINSDHEFDIVFATIPGETQIQFDDQQHFLVKIEQMIVKLTNKIKTLQQDQSDQSALNESEELLKSLRSLAGYHSNLRLLEMVSDRKKFQQLLLTLKLWAKLTDSNHHIILTANYIYNNAMGFLNGTSLGVLAAKIVLLYPDATVPVLLEHFFLTYSAWEWPLPVQIADIQSDCFNWSASDEHKQLLAQFGGIGAHSQLTMPVITPGYPEYNSAYRINWQTAKIIKNAIGEGLKLLHPSAANHAEKWSYLLEQRRKFQERYAKYFLITCLASDQNLFNEFCGFVVTRIRVQLTRLSPCTNDGVDFCHVLSLTNCPQHSVQKYRKISSKMCCKAWLVGVKESSIQSGDQSVHNVSTSELDNHNLKTYFDDIIVNSYKKIVLDRERRGRGHLNLAEQKIQKHFAKSLPNEETAHLQRDFVHLETKYVDKLMAADFY